jgi:hypothetical protein
MKTIPFLFSMFIVLNLQAQQSSDTLFQNYAAANARKLLMEANAQQSGLYNGSAFQEPRLTSHEQFPYYSTNDWIMGSIHYDGIFYTDVPLQYDIVTDEVLTEIVGNGSRIQLIKQKIKYFVLEDVMFVKMSGDGLRNGFHALHYNGTTKVYTRYEKRRQEKIEDRKLNIEFDPKTYYYIFKNGKYFSVRSKGDVFKVLGDRKRELKQFAQKNKLKFNKNKVKSLTKLAAYYDTIQP